MQSEEQRKFEWHWLAVETKMAGYFFRQGCPEEDTRDLVQETAVRACKNYHTLKGEFNPWVFSIAKYVFIDYVRGRKRVAELEDESLIADPKADPESQALTKTLLVHCLKELDPLDRKCLILHDRDGFNFETIGRMLGISTSNAHYHIEKARGSLREKYPDLVRSGGKVE